MNEIGTLSEKSIHKYLKNILEPDKQYHEVKVGQYIADIKHDNKIIEIQTQNFKKLLPKLEYYIKSGYNTTVVYPIIHRKIINWIDPVSMSVVDIRKSSRIGVIQDSFKELYWILQYIVSEEIELKIILIDANEYKYLDGRGQSQKIKATKIDKLPTEIINTVDIRNINDLRVFVPDTLDNNWTSKDYAKVTKCNKRWVSSGLKMLRENNIIEMINKQGNAIIYKTNKL